jgi:SAM-dependent methyltransferase
MATISDNKRVRDGEYRWADQGDEWSSARGGPSMQWYGTILPRIHNFIPTDCILEIACGYGRWTQFLKDMCHSLAVVDLSEQCIAACRERFSGASHVEYHLNDGESLSMISEASIDFVFSFDSLVHADRHVLESYLSQLPRILRGEGVAFMHHSNLGEYAATYSRIRRIPKLEMVLKRVGIMQKTEFWRDSGVTAGVVEGLAEKHGLKCVRQQILTWDTKRALFDCFSILVKSGSSLARNNRILRNGTFMREAENLRRLSHLCMISKQ